MTEKKEDELKSETELTNESVQETEKTVLNDEKHNRAPFIHLTKRVGVTLKEAILVRAISIFAALIFCAILIVIVTGLNPFSVYVTICQGAFGTGRGWVTLKNVALLLGVSLAVTPAFRMHFWNIGAEGQTLIGCLSTAVLLYLLHDKVHIAVLVILMVVSAVFVGALWGFIPAFFKAQWKTNETLFTLMMNYVAIQLVLFFANVATKNRYTTVSQELLGSGVPDLFGVQYLLIIIVVAILTVALYIYLRYTKHGYEISVVGESENTARYIGINVKKVIIRTMILSGAICGLIGFLLVGCVGGPSLKEDSVGGRGFTAIMVSWLAKFDPLMMILTTLLIVFMARGADQISTLYELNMSFSEIITGILLFFIIGCEFFIRYRVHFNFRSEKGKECN